MGEIRFEDRVAIVTGAGGGLGRSHALLLASRGAKVVVNDLGGSVDGSGASQSAADAVVQEIKDAGGDAVASYDSVSTEEGGAAIVQRALDAFGKVDIVVNNAGILRDTSFHKITKDQWDAVIAVHLTGTMNVSRAAWPTMRAQGYGRIVNTSSVAGHFGNFGQSNYGAAKMGIVGLTKALAVEGAKKNIRVNAIAPIARSRMTEELLPEAVLAKIEPSRVSPVVAFLCGEDCPVTGHILAVGGGYVSRVDLVEGPGTVFSDTFSPEDVGERWGAITDLSEAANFPGTDAALAKALGKI
ncbi:MAG: SDR family oxidoreductase [Myxococcota bacterium]